MSCGRPHETPCGKVHEMLDPYLDAELDEPDCEAMKQHFAECPNCENDFYIVRTVKVRLHTACGMSAPEDLRVAIVSFLRGSSRGGGGR